MLCIKDTPLYWSTKRTIGSSPSPSRNTGSWCDSTRTFMNAPLVSSATSRLNGVPENPGIAAMSIDSNTYATMGVAVPSCLKIGQTGSSLSFSPTTSGAGNALTMVSRVITPAWAGNPASMTTAISAAIIARTQRCKRRGRKSLEVKNNCQSPGGARRPGVGGGVGVVSRGYTTAFIRKTHATAVGRLLPGNVCPSTTACLVPAVPLCR